MPLNILFFGTSEFAVPILEKLISDGYNITAVVTQPDKPAGRKQILAPSPVKILALSHNLPVLQPASLKDDFILEVQNLKSKIINLKLIITASYGKIIPKPILNLPRYGALNVHPSLLPKYRGPAPIQYTILNGDKETGVSIMLMDEKMDHGPILSEVKTRQCLASTTFNQLHNKLSQEGAELLIRTIPEWISGKIMPVIQDDAKATYTKIITKEDGRINWDKQASEIERQIRAFTPWPGCWSLLNDKRVKIINAAAIEVGYSEHGNIPGQIIKFQDKKMAVACGQDILEILEIQMEGKKTISGEDFLNGQNDIINSKFQNLNSYC